MLLTFIVATGRAGPLRFSKDSFALACPVLHDKQLVGKALDYSSRLTTRFLPVRQFLIHNLILFEAVVI